MTRSKTSVLTLALLAGTLGFPAAALAAPAAEGASTAHVAGEHADAGHKDPNIVPTPKEGLASAITTLIVFLLLLAVLTKYAWGPISAGLKAREDKIRKDLADAEAARASADAKLRELNARIDGAEGQVRDMIAKATTDADKAAQTIKARAQADAEEIRERATREIEGAKNAAIAEIHEQAAVLATTVAEKILRRSINPDDQRQLVRESIDQLAALKN